MKILMTNSPNMSSLSRQEINSRHYWDVMHSLSHFLTSLNLTVRIVITINRGATTPQNCQVYSLIQSMQEVKSSSPICFSATGIELLFFRPECMLDTITLGTCSLTFFTQFSFGHARDNISHSFYLQDPSIVWADV